MMTTNIKHLYIHVPFCKTICSYCDFCHRLYDSKLVYKWLKTIEQEIHDKCKDEYETVYIGGGTPTSLKTSELNKLLSLLKPLTVKVKEYTIEVNPESLDLDKINLFKQYGINRVSMGVQTSDDNLLKLLNRKHSFLDVKNTILLLKENNIDNISIDLMYSLPGQTMEILSKTIDDFIELDIPHVSIYSLTIEENSVFGKKGYKTLDVDLEADMYEMIVNALNEYGYSQYEVSNFSKKGSESKHNIGYWEYEDFLGISMSSSSKVGNKRWTNTKSFQKYFDNYNNLDEILDLNKEDMMFENIMMSLRMKKGLNIENFNIKYNTNLIEKYKKALNNKNLYIDNGYLKIKNLAILNNTLLDFLN